ncbi:UDP-glucuronosyltransferase 1-1 [Homalodisca vitripennis]|nr:UDP-glucuronosyltransferase 1-1 [Homalodisca vitripennis]
MKLLVLLFVIVQCLQVSTAARILALCSTASHSHSLWCFQYMSALAERGHQTTVLALDEPKIKVPNMTTFLVDRAYEETFTDGIISDWLSNRKIGMINVAFKNWDEASSKAIMHSKALKELIKQNENKKKPFDLIIHDHTSVHALLGMVPLFGNPPLILASTFGTPQWLPFRAGNIFNPAYVPSMITSADHHMTFYQRCENLFYYIFLEWYTKFVTEPFQDQLMREVFGPNLPHVRDIVKQANIIIVNHHFAMNSPRPVLPGVVEIAGLHISKPKPLPQDLKDFMDGAEHGVILLSFGSNVASNWLGEGFEDKVLLAIRQLPQRVIWKWDRDISNIPPNVKLSKWLPQNDIMAHPKLRLFITHCGLLSTQEAIYRRVPIMGLPVFCDQMDNAELLARRNLSIYLDPQKITSELFLNSVKEMLSNPMYKKNMERMSDLMTDMPLTSKQQAVFWSEYAIRHQGAPHLRSAAADMSWIQLLMLDVIGTVFLILLVVLWIVKTVLLFVLRKFISSTLKIKED